MADITERLRELSKARWDKDAWERETTVRIPAEPDRDIDLVLSNAAAEIDRLRARVAELESQPADQFTAELVELDGHTYGLRPGAARVVREALRYRNALACIATVAATEHDYQELALRVLGETDHMKLIQWRNAAIDAAMAKDGA